jgi:hypothetical protein
LVQNRLVASVLPIPGDREMISLPETWGIVGTDYPNALHFGATVHDLLHSLEAIIVSGGYCIETAPGSVSPTTHEGICADNHTIRILFLFLRSTVLDSHFSSYIPSASEK